LEPVSANDGVTPNWKPVGFEGVESFLSDPPNLNPVAGESVVAAGAVAPNLNPEEGVSAVEELDPNLNPDEVTDPAPAPNPEAGLEKKKMLHIRESRAYFFCLLHASSSLYNSPFEIFLFPCPASPTKFVNFKL